MAAMEKLWYNSGRSISSCCVWVFPLKKPLKAPTACLSSSLSWVGCGIKEEQHVRILLRELIMRGLSFDDKAER